MAGPRVRASEAGGRTWDDPSETTLHDALADMNLRWPFVVVERLDREPAGQHFMQVYLNDDGSYQVEYRAGGEHQHFQAHVPPQPPVVGVEPVARILAAWAFDKPGWQDALPWEPLPPA